MSCWLWSPFLLFLIAIHFVGPCDIATWPPATWSSHSRILEQLEHFGIATVKWPRMHCSSRSSSTETANQWFWDYFAHPRYGTTALWSSRKFLYNSVSQMHVIQQLSLSTAGCGTQPGYFFQCQLATKVPEPITGAALPQWIQGSQKHLCVWTSWTGNISPKGWACQSTAALSLFSQQSGIGNDTN